MTERETRNSSLNSNGQLDRILAAAVALADEIGLDDLSIRKLASKIGVAPMTLYGYVTSKDDLLDQMADRTLATFEVPSVTSGDWAAHIRKTMIAFRQLLLRHPSLVGLLSTRRVTSVGLTRATEAILSHLHGAGLPADQCVKTHASLLTYTLGFVAFELPRQQAAEAAPYKSDEFVLERLEAHTRERDFPMVKELATEIARMSHGDSFEYGLDVILEGVRARVAEAHD